MDKALFQSAIVEERSQLASIKRDVHNLVRNSFTEQRTGEIDIVVAEMLSNVLKYGVRGELLYRLSLETDTPLFELICMDQGPGIKDIPHSSKDGISSKSTLGHGLGSIIRLSNFCQIYSAPGWGTILYTKFYRQLNYEPTPKTGWILKCLNVAMPGQLVSGDGYALRELDGKLMLLTGDGLGHGPHAKDAMDKAIKIFKDSSSSDAAALVREMHTGIKRSRGLVATVAVVDFQRKKWEICGIGNILTRLQKGLDYRNYIGHNGIISVNVPTRIENAVWEMEKFQLLVCCSDGIKTRWDLLRYPSILKYDPMIIAAAIYKDHARKTDDMTVLIIKVI